MIIPVTTGLRMPFTLDKAMTNTQLRKRTITLPANIPSQHLSAIINDLNSRETVNSVSCNESILTIQYRFPAIVFSDILGAVDQHLDLAQTGLTHKPRYALRAWLEDNERDHQCLHEGWDKYTRDIHVAHSRSGYSTMAQLKKQWQQYRNPAKPDTN